MNFMITLLGWFLWNWGEFSITKQDVEDGNKQKISLSEYAQLHYETWVGSFACMFLLLWIGFRNLSLDPFEVVIGAKLGWNDLYLLGSGAAWDAFIFGIKWIKKFLKKRDNGTVN